MVDGFRRPWSKSANHPLRRAPVQDHLKAFNYLAISVLTTSPVCALKRAGIPVA
jgi:hypothetical protein